jgi:hypothetical protein
MIKETKDYVLVVGNNKDHTGFSYQIVNKEFKVIEIETTLLPQALNHIADLQAALNSTGFSDKPSTFKA